MQNDLLVRLATQLEHLAPHVYAVLLRQVCIDAVGEAIACAVLLAGAVWLWKRKPIDPVFAYVVAVCAAVIAGGCAFDVFSALLNPEYAAIKLLLHK